MLMDIAPIEVPYHESEKVKKEKEIQRKINSLELDFDLAKHEELQERMMELGEHFEDSWQIAKMLKMLWPKLKLEEADKSEVLLGALLHDIGKTGPAEATPELRQCISGLFRSPVNKFNIYKNVAGKNVLKTVADFIRETEQVDFIECRERLRSDLEVDIETETMIDFWRRHADWSYDILFKEALEQDLHNEKAGQKITSDLVIMAASHHILDNKNPANIKIEDIPASSRALEIMDKYEILALADKYQAFIDRGHLNHTETISALRNIVEQSKLSTSLKKDYNKFIDILASSEVELKSI